MGRQKPKIHLSHILARASRFGEEKREKKRKKRRRRRLKRYVFVLESSVFWIPRALVWRLVAPLSRVLKEITQTLDFCWGYEGKTLIGGK